MDSLQAGAFYSVVTASCRAPGGAGALVESMGPDLLVAVLSPTAANATVPPALLVVDVREESSGGSLDTRSVPLRLNSSVAATTPVEGDCETMGMAGALCNKGWRGATLPARFRLPAGSAQLLGLVMRTG